MKKNVLIIAAAFLLLLTACVLTAAGCKKTDEKKPVIMGFTPGELTNPAMIALRDSLAEIIEARGDTLLAADGLNDQIKQNNVIEDFITQGISVLFIMAVDQNGITPALEACKDAGVKVINVDTRVDRQDLVETYVASNNFVAGQQCGQAILKDFPDGANIAMLEVPWVESVTSRIAGVEDVIKGTNSKVIARQNVGSLDKTLSQIEDFILANPDLNCFFGLNDQVALMMVGSVDAAGLGDKIKVYGVDGSPAGKASIAAGGLAGTAAQSFKKMGNTAAELAYKVLAGEKLEPLYSIDTIMITKDNIGDFTLDVFE